MKKILISVLMSIAVVCGTANAQCITDSTVTIYVDGSGNWKLNASYDVTNDSGCDATLFVVSYFNNEIINIDTYEVNESKVINDVLVCKTADGTAVTPEAVKVYMWQNGKIKPLSVSEAVLTEDKLEAANKTFTDNLKDFQVAFNHLDWTEADESIVRILNRCMNDVMTLNKQYLLTPEFVQRHYFDEISETKRLHDELTKEEQSALHSKLTRIDPTELFAYFINYFGLKKWV